jgi:hypothetical protein
MVVAGTHPIMGAVVSRHRSAASTQAAAQRPAAHFAPGGELQRAVDWLPARRIGETARKKNG